MQNFTFSFNEENFNNIFPFHILLNEEFLIKSMGRSLRKICPLLKENERIDSFFYFKRPFIDEVSPADLNNNLNQLTLLECKTGDKLVLRGQFQKIGSFFIFMGSPWFVSLDDVKQRKLSIGDFSNFDPLLDLLQILRSQQITTQELKEQLKINEEQKEALKQDREQLNLLSLVASANETAIVFTTPDAKIFWCNNAYLQVTGYTLDEIIGKSPIEVGRAYNSDKNALIQMADLFYRGESFDVEVTHGRKDGSYFWTRTKGQPIYDSDGKLVQYFAMIEDKTIEKEQEEQLRLLSLIAQKNMNAVIICDKEGYIEWCNPAFSNITGYDFKEIIGKKPGPLLQGPDSNPETIKYLNRQIKKGEPFSCEIINYKKNGESYWIKIQGQALYNNWGQITRYFAIEEDITEHKQLEKQREQLLISLEKSNTELEDYAQIVSHDLKSPLRSINSLIAWIKEDNEGVFNEQTTQYFSMIEGKLEKMDHLIQGVLTYSKINKTDLVKENVNLQEVIENIINIIHIPQNISVFIKGTMPILKADRFRMHQLFQNLISNAVAYVDKPSGIVEIGAESSTARHIFYVRDNGPGIEKKNFEKVFKIFQSLEKNEKSTGLGLSIVKKIVDNYNGRVWIESELGQGTTFYIEFPVSNI
ncbi:PAS domain-containing protein [Flavobacterium rhizosphaerae]|uniref:PAS domain-containing protein n=1 Tax=Flavobacterium rhizosphaerae TaxID=3163298 RepID=A0ABW8Z0R8_9FLAO